MNNSFRAVLAGSGIGLLVLLLACGGSSRRNDGGQPGNTAANSTANVPANANANAPAAPEKLQVLPADDEIAAQAATDLNAKITGAKNAGTLTMEAGKPISIGLVGTRDDESFSDKNYAAYLAQRIVEALTQINDAPFVVVAIDAERKALIDKRLSEATANEFNYDQLANSINEQVPTNLGLFIEVRPKSDTLEEMSLRLYEVGRGTVLLAKSYPYDSPYLAYLQQGQAAEQSGNAEQAQEYYTLASEARRGTQSKAQSSQQRVQAKFTPAELNKFKEINQMCGEARQMMERGVQILKSNTPNKEDRAKKIFVDARNLLLKAQQIGPKNLTVKKMLDDLDVLARKYKAHEGRG